MKKKTQSGNLLSKNKHNKEGLWMGVYRDEK
jgi:hypothetical protein